MQYVICNICSLNRNDPRLYKDDVDIRFSRTLNSCKLPQIRYASPERLFERLTDLRFLSIDFLNTFLLTYRCFTDGVTVLEALKKVHYNPDVSTSPVADDTGAINPPSGGQGAAIENAAHSSSLPTSNALHPPNIPGHPLTAEDFDFGRRANLLLRKKTE